MGGEVLPLFTCTFIVCIGTALPYKKYVYQWKGQTFFFKSICYWINPVGHMYNIKVYYSPTNAQVIV